MPGTDLHGLIVPVVLPLDSSGAPDFSRLGSLCTELLDAGARGIWVNGSTGEVHDLALAERAAVVSAVSAAVGGRGVVVAHVGDTSTKLAVAQAVAAASSGATHLGAVAPYYAAYSAGEIGRYYEELAQASALPLVLYNLPQMVKVTLPLPLVVRLASQGTAVGVKDTAGDFAWYRTLLHALAVEGVPFGCFMGVESLVDVSLFAGGAGAVCTLANLVPSTFASLVAAGASGDWPAARLWQAEVVSLVRALSLPSRGEWIGSIAALKWVMCELGALPSATVAAPTEPLTLEEQRHLATTAVPLAARLRTAA